MKSKAFKNIISVASIIVILILAVFFVKAYIDGNFSSKESLQTYIKGFGMFGPIVLTFIQALQVVVPVLPGFLGCAVGAVLFGSEGGFWCNYIGISAGSIIAFFLARKYGTCLVQSIFSKEKYEKWSGWIEKKKSYSLVLLLVILLPLFPDDFFCYFSGLTKMSSKKFIWIILIGKPWCILVYSLLFANV